MKKRILCPELPKKGIPAILSDTEAHHAIRVLRLKDGERVEAMDGNGSHSMATLRIRGGKPRLEFQLEALLSEKQLTSPLSFPIFLEMAVLKGEAMEWVVEKSVELGVKGLIPVLTDHTVVQMKSKGPEAFKERWQKIADQSLKQCGRLDRLEIEIPIQLESLLLRKISEKQHYPHSIRLWCDEAGIDNSPFISDSLTNHFRSISTTSQSSVHILVGPEGGWSSQERLLLDREVKMTSQTSTNSIHSNFQVHLGKQIMRAETAALFTVSVVSAGFQSMENK